jgi:hypothetical protein
MNATCRESRSEAECAPHVQEVIRVLENHSRSRYKSLLRNDKSMTNHDQCLTKMLVFGQNRNAQKSSSTSHAQKAMLHAHE